MNSNVLSEWFSNVKDDIRHIEINPFVLKNQNLLTSDISQLAENTNPTDDNPKSECTESINIDINEFINTSYKDTTIENTISVNRNIDSIDENSKPEHNTTYQNVESDNDELVVDAIIVYNDNPEMINNGNLSLTKNADIIRDNISSTMSERPACVTYNDVNYMDITPYFGLSQTEASKILKCPASSLSRRWKQSVGTKRKWPYKHIQNIDGKINSILLNIHSRSDMDDVKKDLELLLLDRLENLQPVYIRDPRYRVIKRSER
jgi:hypothetical protein